MSKKNLEILIFTASLINELKNYKQGSLYIEKEIIVFRKKNSFIDKQHILIEFAFIMSQVNFTVKISIKFTQYFRMGCLVWPTSPSCEDASPPKLTAALPRVVTKSPDEGKAKSTKNQKKPPRFMKMDGNELKNGKTSWLTN